MEKEELDIREIYEKLEEKYSLPEFEKISKDFDIEKISNKESMFLVREVRRIINEKISAYIHLLETLINPTSPPIFVFSILKNISTIDKDIIKEIYKSLSKTQIEIMKLDTIYNEAAEVEFIKKTFIIWQELKPKIYKLIERFESSFNEDDLEKRESYFG